MLKLRSMWGVVARWALVAAVWVTAIWASVSWAQAVVPQGADAAGNDVLPFTPDVAHDVLLAAQSRRWGWLVAIVVGVLAKALIWAGRKFDVTSKVGHYVHLILDLPGAAWAIPLIGSVTGSLVTSYAAGTPVSFDLIMQAVLVGGFAGGWNTTKAVQVEQAKDAGKVAAAEVVSKQAAISVIRGPDAKP